MCFTRGYRNGMAKMAVEDIFAFKLLKKDNTGFQSPSRNCFWEIGALQKEPAFERLNDHGNINRALHCCKTFEDAKSYQNNTYHGRRNIEVYQVKIPRGSLYWENDTQICADQMILVSGQRYLKNGELSKKKEKIKK